jgi:hypothetical protein
MNVDPTPAVAQTVYRRKPDTISANLGAELAVLDLPGGSYLGFNATAAHVWRLLQDPHTFEQICAAMIAEFEVEPALCGTEIHTLLNSLLAAGLITASDEPLA